jgi:hypothetical protein
MKMLPDPHKPSGHAVLAERGMRNGFKPGGGDFLAASHADSKCTIGNAVERRINGCEFHLSLQAKAFENFIIFALGGAVFAVRVGLLVKIGLDLSKPRRQFCLAGEKGGFIGICGVHCFVLSVSAVPSAINQNRYGGMAHHAISR